MANRHENPLLPHRRMRELFRCLLRMRSVLPAKRWAAGDFAIATSIGARDLPSVRVCATDPRLHPAVRLALGQSRQQLRQDEPELRLQQALQAHASNQIYFALGVARASRSPVLVLVAADALSGSRWQRVLKDAATLDAPAVFVTLPGRSPGLGRVAQSAGVPAIPVDSADPIALYRVAGECLGRATAGGGPALLEGVRIAGSPDAKTLFRRQMLARGAATEEWAERWEQLVRSRPSRNGTSKQEAWQLRKKVH